MEIGRPRDAEEMALIAARLRKKRETILRLWAEAACEKLPAAKKQTRPALYDALPLFLDDIARAVSSTDKTLLPDKEIGREHGEQRSNLVDYSLREVVEEYGILQETIFDVLEEAGPVPLRARKIILRSIMTGITEASAEFGKIHDSVREQFVAIITHDLKNPLTAAKISTQMIPRFVHKPEKVDELAGRAVASIQRVELMLQDLLDTFQLRAGKPLPVSIKPDDLKRVAQEALDELATVYGARFVLESPPRVPAEFSSDGIRRSIENLANNAVKYGDPEKPVTVKIYEMTPEKVAISVHNHGNPLIAEEQAKLFHPFHRAPFAQASGRKGWGLGLTLVQGVVQAHHGHVSVSSSLEEGTTFTLHLPRRRGPGSLL